VRKEIRNDVEGGTHVAQQRRDELRGNGVRKIYCLPGLSALSETVATGNTRVLTSVDQSHRDVKLGQFELSSIVDM
jgi:hypothetical protein